MALGVLCPSFLSASFNIMLIIYGLCNLLFDDVIFVLMMGVLYSVMQVV